MSLSAQATPRSESAPPDNATNKWNDFAAKEFQEHRTRTFRTRHINESPSPKVTSPKITSPQPPHLPPPPAISPDSTNSWQTFAAQESKAPQSESFPRRTPTPATATPRRSVSESTRASQPETTFSVAPRQNCQRGKLLPDPPICFCKRPAHLRTTDGVMYYECHSYNAKNQIICLFHVHKDNWDRLGQQVRDNKPLDKSDPGITGCPAFNLTFGILTRINDSHAKYVSETLRCFCNKRVILNWHVFKCTQRPYFSCPDLTTLDAPLRCGFFVWAEDARFKIPEIPLHSPLSPPSSSLSSSSYSSTSSEQPKTEVKPVSPPVVSTDEDASIYNPPKPLVFLPHKIRVEDDSRPNFIQLLQGAKAPAWYIPQREDEEEKTKSNSALIPSSVLSYQALRNRTLDKERAKERQPSEEKLQELKQQIETLDRAIERLKIENEQQRQQNLAKQQEIDALLAEQERRTSNHQELLERTEKLLLEKDNLRTAMDATQVELNEELRLRQKSQTRYVQLEIIVRDLLDAQDRLTKEVHDKEEKLNLKDLKCRVCFQENIEYALVPCYHCSYCMTCAEKLSECAICRTTKFAVQKVYMA